MSQELHKCSNCEQPFDESYKFCPYCGQKSDDDLTLGVLFYNTISNYFSFDARFFKSFVPLMIKPGFLPKKFVSGKRLTYIHPAQMYLFVSVIFFFVFGFNVRESRASIDKAMQKPEQLLPKEEELQEATKVIDSVMNEVKSNQEIMGMSGEDVEQLDSIITEKSSERYDSRRSGNVLGTSFSYKESKIDSMLEKGVPEKEIYIAMGMKEDAGAFQQKFFSQLLKFHKERGLGAIYQTFIDSIPITLFFLLPIFGLLLKLFFYKKGRYAHHLVFSFYFFSFLFTVFSIDLIINRFIDVPDFMDWLLALSTFFYFFIGVKRYYGQGWILSYIKSSVVSFFFSIAVLIAAIGLGVFAFMYY